MIRMAIVLLSLTSALGSPADPLLERVLSHKHQLQLRPLTSRKISREDVLELPRLSRQLEDVTTPPADVSESGRQVRLVGGPGPWEGAVEIYTASGWHQVVANRWSEVEASVVCRQLGHTSYFRAAPLPTAILLSLNDTDDAPVSIHKCSGREASLLDCERSAAEGPAQPVSVSCLSAEDLSKRCGESELPFGDSCYFIGRESVTRLKAELHCRQRNAALVVVNSQLKNDFLSGVISSVGLEGLHTAGRSHRLGKTETIWSWESSDAPFLFTKWKPDELSAEPLGVEQRCITLEPSETASVAELGYAFWASSDCSRRLQYVCETPRDWTDCARDVAGSYAGSVSTAESGRLCLQWSAMAGVPGLSSAALVANHCRNPDGDRRPWCFTGPDQFEYCDIAACPPHLPPPRSPKEDNYTCHSLQFACVDGRCTSVLNVCDGERDCPDGRDETVCSALPASFQTFDSMDFGFALSTRITDFISADIDISARTCQFLCLADPSCYAVGYVISKKGCVRIFRPMGEFLLISEPLSSVHVVLSRYRPCSGHRCDDFLCLNRTGVRCDGVNDCSDFSDELECAAEAPVPLRLVDGAAAGSGRLEARFQGRWGAVCDDGFTSHAADVACRQLGFNRHRRMFLNGRGYPAAAGAAYAVTATVCRGEEEQLADCILKNTEDRCTDGEQVSLECTNEVGKCTLYPNFFECLDRSNCVAPSEFCDGHRKCSDGSDESEDVCPSQKVRLVGASQPPRVEIKPAGSNRPFLSVTSRAFGEQEANFLCRSLGVGPYGVPVEDVRLLPEQERVADVLCSGAANCSVQTTWPGPGARAVRLRCLTEKPPPPLLRLVGGNERSGLLELRPPIAEANWGRVCAVAFNAAQAKVVCRQLGFSGESGFLELSRNPNITVSLRAMDCLGDEADIMACFRQPWANATGPEVCDGSGEVYLSCDAPGKPLAPAAPLTPQCAADAADVDRVLGGQAAGRGELPAFAQLHFGIYKKRKLRCGATVLSERFVLTAAHCVKWSPNERLVGLGDELPVPGLSVLVGGGQRVAVRRVIPHPGHRLLALQSDDLALVELERSLEFSAEVQPACLPPQDASYSPGLACSVAGYGSTGPQRGPTADASPALPSDTLRVGNVTFFTRDECQGFYGRRNITLGMVCAGDEQFEVDTCDGDSGGPLVCRLGDASVLMGVTSWGLGCGRTRQPGVYVRVASYVPWIRAVTQGAPAA